jgi:hypothetical protein
LTRVIRRFYSDRPIIQIIKANGDIDQAERTINAIEKAFTPLNSSIYQDKQIILIDLPSEQTQGGVTDFLQRNPNLNANNQFFQISNRDLEQYYPNQPDEVYVNWRKTQAELDAVNPAGKKSFTGKKKRQLAKFVGENITRVQFEEEMPIIFQALEKTWELVY